ncbi:hypothetical protein [Pedobacter roseus]|uniref:Uncharacterized protein n=1 Tax=Pedobacter roseus TaxID=336820 RepID=A0A7G9QH89_9SPHI|nr:hypothetical protein [Pedobacter roseus]QNN42714.1 hypothetical protein H9L23_00930 [Pedobacter roseus]
MRIKSIHLFVLAIVMAATTAFVSTGSSHERLTRYYYYDNDGTGPNAQDWHTTEPSSSLEIECLPASTICSADFDKQPVGSPVSNGAIATNVDNGLYQ